MVVSFERAPPDQCSQPVLFSQHQFSICLLKARTAEHAVSRCRLVRSERQETGRLMDSAFLVRRSSGILPCPRTGMHRSTEGEDQGFNMFHDHGSAELSAPQYRDGVAATISLAPITPWNVDWFKTTCTLRRAFGTKEDPSVLTIERFGPSGTFQLSIMSSDFRSFQQGQDINLGFGKAKPHSIKSVSPGRTGADGKAILFFSTQSLGGSMKLGGGEWDPPVTPAMEAATRTISVSYSGRERIFVTGPLDKPIAALISRQQLGFRRQATGRASSAPRPIGNPARWISDSDYP